MFKDLSPSALLEDARQAKPFFLYDPRREIQTYRSILAPARLGTPTCYGAVLDKRRGRYWLFLERVPGLRLAQVGAFSTWQQAARWLAVLHGRWAGKAEQMVRTAHLLRWDAVLYRTWLPRAQTFLARAASSQPAGTRRHLAWLAARYERVVRRLVALPRTVVHGEFYASNILVQETAAGPRVCPVDWEMAALGPGLLDLAALSAGQWTEEERLALAQAYHATLTPHGDGQPTAEFLSALACCHLHLAVQWLGWAPAWSVPPEQQQDWLREALRQAEKLGL
jgi:thiamine kinase-like enzyme